MCAEKEPLKTVGVNVNWYSHSEKTCMDFTQGQHKNRIFI